MGQYFRIVNLDKREWFDPDAFDETEKHPQLCPKTMEALAVLLMTAHSGFTMVGGATRPSRPDGRWCGDRIVIVGDEAQGCGADERWWSFTDILIDSEFSDDVPSTWRNIAEEIGGKRWIGPYENDPQ